MRTISVNQLPPGFEIDKPTFLDWMKAGIAFTLGAGIVTVAAAVAWFFLGMAMLNAMYSGRLH